MARADGGVMGGRAHSLSFVAVAAMTQLWDPKGIGEDWRSIIYSMNV